MALQSRPRTVTFPKHTPGAADTWGVPHLFVDRHGAIEPHYSGRQVIVELRPEDDGAVHLKAHRPELGGHAETLRGRVPPGAKFSFPASADPALRGIEALSFQRTDDGLTIHHNKGRLVLWQEDGFEPPRP